MTQRLRDLAAAIGVDCPPAWASATVRGIADDSRQVEPGFLFVARRGTHDDGQVYLGEALERGAAAIVAEAEVAASVPHFVVADGRVALARLAATFYDHPTRELLTVGVTGTNGKTSVCHFVAHLLGAASTTVVSTVANVDRGLRALTTPPSPIVQRIARDAVDAGHTALVLEASSAGLAQHRLDEVAFDAAVFTNLTRDHLDLHGTMEAYGGAKALLFSVLPTSATAILNADDAYSEVLRQVCRCRTLTYALGPGADLRAEELVENEEGASFTVRWGGAAARRVRTPVHGTYGASNALAALGAALVCGAPWKTAVERLESLPSVAGRWERFRRDDGAVAVVDFAHTPDGLLQALAPLRRMYRRVVVVFGCPGASDVGRRGPMGAIATRLADLVVLTADNPKDEAPERILDDIESGIDNGSARPVRELDRRRAIERAASEVEAGDVLLLAGKGHETYQIVEGRFLPHSDSGILETLGFHRASRSADRSVIRKKENA